MNKHKVQKLKFSIIKRFAQLALIVSLFTLLAVVFFVLIRGIPFVNMQLLFGEYGMEPSILPAIFGTFYLIIIAISIAAPIGIGSAIFLTEYTNGGADIILD